MPILIRRLLMSALNIQGSPLLQRVSGAHCRPLVSLLELPTQLHGCRSSRMRVLQQSALPQWRPEPPERAVFPQPRPHQLPQTAGNLRCRVVPSASSAEVLQRVQETAAIDLEYDPLVNSYYWQRRPVAVVSRAIQIGAAFSTWFAVGRLRRGGDPAALAVNTQRQAERLKDILTQLGPAFVKIGQAVSSRPDLLPPVYLAELEKLQDQIPPFPNADAYAVIQLETGQAPSALFSELSADTVAAASLGQVYRGRLRSTGKGVAVKVQRPGVREQIALDVHILRMAAAFLRRARKLNSDLPALLDEWAGSLFRELDYRREAANGTRFKALYGRLEGVFVPDMYEDLTTQRVLIMEWVEGRRLRTGTSGGGYGSAGDESDLGLVEVGVRCSLEQMLEEGYYHSDPHAGNLLRTTSGDLAYIDFGMMGEIEPSIRRGLIQATLHLVNREYAALAEDFITLGLLPPGSDRGAIIPALTGVFQNALAGGVSNISFGELSGNLGTAMYQYSFQIPSYYTLLVRSLSVLEGIALASDPNYKVLGATYPWIARRLLTDTSPELQETLTSLLYKGGRFQFSRLESLLEQAARSPGRSTLSNSSPQTGTSTASGLEMLLSPNVAYVRSILLDEMAKGVDSAARLAADNAVSRARDTLRTAFSALMGVQRQQAAAPVEPDPLAALMDSLAALPRLADQEDEIQVEGITRLATLLQQISVERQGLSASQVGSMQQSAAFLQWLLAEAASLSPDARTAAFWLPVELATKLSSRISARILRAAFTVPPDQPAQAAAAAAGRRAAAAASSAGATPAQAQAAAAQAAAGAAPFAGGASSTVPPPPPYQATPDMAAQQLNIEKQEKQRQQQQAVRPLTGAARPTGAVPARPAPGAGNPLGAPGGLSSGQVTSVRDPASGRKVRREVAMKTLVMPPTPPPPPPQRRMLRRRWPFGRRKLPWWRPWTRPPLPPRYRRHRLRRSRLPPPARKTPTNCRW
mmetsp:Transcript_19608/g.59305  ORF Transcript_19608/g.59305 Transcript_19608/m.59305 type:complete len:979 (-) Transcript_19608:2833-5769(-)